MNCGRGVGYGGSGDVVSWYNGGGCIMELVGFGVVRGE